MCWELFWLSRYLLIVCWCCYCWCLFSGRCLVFCVFDVWFWWLCVVSSCFWGCWSMVDCLLLLVCVGCFWWVWVCVLWFWWLKESSCRDWLRLCCLCWVWLFWVLWYLWGVLFWSVGRVDVLRVVCFWWCLSNCVGRFSFCVVFWVCVFCLLRVGWWLSFGWCGCGCLVGDCMDGWCNGLGLWVVWVGWLSRFEFGRCMDWLWLFLRVVWRVWLCGGDVFLLCVCVWCGLCVWGVGSSELVG